MLTLFGSRPANRNSANLSRRSFLQLGTLGLGGLTLADLLRGRARAAVRPASHKSVIMVFLGGGPSHIDTYDMKPEAPVEYRGEFKPIRTNVSGIDLCELMPLQAKIADKFAIVQGVKFSGGHGSHEVHTGFGRSGRPVLGSVVSRLHGGMRQGMPTYVNFPFAGPEFSDPGDPAYLGLAHQPFDPQGRGLVQNLRLSPGMTLDRLSDRKTLLGSFDTLRRDLDNRGQLVGMDAFTEQALEMIVSPRVREALDVRQEPDRVRALYGEDQHSQAFLQARRLVEAGVSVVSLAPMYSDSKLRTELQGNWDTHGSNFARLRHKLPLLDRSLYALISDLHARGLDEDVAVLVCGEMGRTPRVGQSTGAMTGADGRDHWPTGFALLAGGGLRTGQVVGATDSRAERSKGRTYIPQNLLATLYHVLGIDPGATFPDHSGRPQYLLDEREKIAELL